MIDHFRAAGKVDYNALNVWQNHYEKHESCYCNQCVGYSYNLYYYSCKHIKAICIILLKFWIADLMFTQVDVF